MTDEELRIKEQSNEIIDRLKVFKQRKLGWPDSGSSTKYCATIACCEVPLGVFSLENAPALIKLVWEDAIAKIKATGDDVLILGVTSIDGDGAVPKHYLQIMASWQR